jgi:hypothetical protein
MPRSVSQLAFVAVLACFAREGVAQATCANANGTTAQCTSSGTQITITAHRTVRLEVTPTHPTLTGPTLADYPVGTTTTKTDLGAQALEVKANIAWALTMTASPWTAPYAKPIGDAEFTTDGGGGWTAFSGGSQALSSGASTAGTTITLGFRVNWGLLADPPGVYTLPVMFLVSSS